MRNLACFTQRKAWWNTALMPAYCSWSGVAKLSNNIILERDRSLLSNVGLGEDLWVEVMNNTYWLVNRLSPLATDWKTLEKMWWGKPSNYTKLKMLCLCEWWCIGVEDKEVYNPRACTWGIGVQATVQWDRFVDLCLVKRLPLTNLPYFRRWEKDQL